MIRALSLPLILLLSLLPAISSSAASDDTNAIPTLTIKGATYTNVHVSKLTPVDALVVFDGGGIRVHWTELPETVQKRFGYDPVKAKEYLAAKNGKKTAAASPAPPTTMANEGANVPAANQTAPNLPVANPPTVPLPAAIQPPAKQPAAVSQSSADARRMRVINIVATNIYARCMVSVDGSESEVLLDRLPPAVKQSFEGVYSLETMLIDFAKKVDADKAKAAAENAAASPTGVLDGAHLQKRIDDRRQAELDLFNVQREEKDLAQMKAYLKSVRDENQKTANILAVPTGKTFAGAQIWKCVGQSP